MFVVNQCFREHVSNIVFALHIDCVHLSLLNESSGSMPFIALSCTGFSAYFMHAALSSKMTVGSGIEYPISVRKFLIAIISMATSYIALYSASAELPDADRCFPQCHAIVAFHSAM